MVKLSAKGRKALPKSDFGVPSKAPGSGSYPMPDKTHARVAKAYAERFASPSEKAAIDAKANKILGKGSTSKTKASAKSMGEGSPADMRQDRAQAKRTGQTMKQVERSAEDKKRDKARMAGAMKTCPGCGKRTSSASCPGCGRRM